MAVLILIYGSENWTLKTADARQSQTAEMKFLKHVSEHSLFGHVHNRLCSDLNLKWGGESRTKG
jgi:hypothetical protein